MTTPTKRPPTARGKGRISLQGAGTSPVIQVRVTPEQKAKVESLGGAVWVRKMIDKARLPAINSEG
jgi:hypothetical protein